MIQTHGTDRKEIQKEINQLTSEINRIGNTTEFNTQEIIKWFKWCTVEVFSKLGAEFKVNKSTSTVAVDDSDGKAFRNY